MIRPSTHCVFMSTSLDSCKQKFPLVCNKLFYYRSVESTEMKICTDCYNLQLREGTWMIMYPFLSFDLAGLFHNFYYTITEVGLWWSQLPFSFPEFLKKKQKEKNIVVSVSQRKQGCAHPSFVTTSRSRHNQHHVFV